MAPKPKCMRQTSDLTRDDNVNLYSPSSQVCWNRQLPEANCEPLFASARTVNRAVSSSAGASLRPGFSFADRARMCPLSVLGSLLIRVYKKLSYILPIKGRSRSNGPSFVHPVIISRCMRSIRTVEFSVFFLFLSVFCVAVCARFSANVFVQFSVASTQFASYYMRERPVCQFHCLSLRLLNCNVTHGCMVCDSHSELSHFSSTAHKSLFLPTDGCGEIIDMNIINTLLYSYLWVTPGLGFTNRESQRSYTNCLLSVCDFVLTQTRMSICKRKSDLFTADS